MLFLSHWWVIVKVLCVLCTISWSSKRFAIFITASAQHWSKHHTNQHTNCDRIKNVFHFLFLLKWLLFDVTKDISINFFSTNFYHANCQIQLSTNNNKFTRNRLESVIIQGLCNYIAVLNDRLSTTGYQIQSKTEASQKMNQNGSDLKGDTRQTKMWCSRMWLLSTWNIFCFCWEKRTWNGKASAAANVLLWILRWIAIETKQSLWTIYIRSIDDMVTSSICDFSKSQSSFA